MDIVDITFTHVSVTASGYTATISGTIAVNYTTGAVTGSLTATFTGSPEVFPVTFNSFLNVNLTGPTFVIHAIQALSNNLEFVYGPSQSPTSLIQLGLSQLATGLNFNGPPFATNTLSSVPCFAAGTLIRTPRGDVQVESLEAGDLVVTASGGQRPVKWIGHSDFDLRNHPNPRPVFPVRIAADAFGPNRPSQDLYVSTGHSVCIDLCGEVFIPVGNMINGATIAQIEVEEISYWHVELDSHDILIANNLPAESYLAMGNRGFFEEALS